MDWEPVCQLTRQQIGQLWSCWKVFVFYIFVGNFSVKGATFLRAVNKMFSGANMTFRCTLKVYYVFVKYKPVWLLTKTNVNIWLLQTPLATVSCIKSSVLVCLQARKKGA